MVQLLEDAVNQSRLRWLDHALHMPTERLSLCMLLSETGSSRTMAGGDHSTTWVKSVKLLTNLLAGVGRIWTPGSGSTRSPQAMVRDNRGHGSVPHSVDCYIRNLFSSP